MKNEKYKKDKLQPTAKNKIKTIKPNVRMD